MREELKNAMDRLEVLIPKLSEIQQIRVVGQVEGMAITNEMMEMKREEEASQQEEKQ